MNRHLPSEVPPPPVDDDPPPVLFVLSMRNPVGDEYERHGPYEHVILRPGSNWIEVRSDGAWSTISMAGATRVLIRLLTAEQIAADRERNRRDWSW